MARAIFIQVETNAWLVINEVYTPRFLIRYVPAVHRQTGETHMLYQVQRWQPERKDRVIVGWHDTYAEAEAQCRAAVETPDMATPIRDGYGSAITPEEQKARWVAGLDPRTGLPRESRP
ncbi:hypothetical protein [Microbacterium rhizosphaerae]|uniref:Uncharacterized protein n=1 Tax=Microbacterium rhizosphaerae TaxID=1678237 RepID=A0ABZ0SQW2_9MICO|nr:hypothetical protein [Microbacterium rhizosphaerae]WPR89701.1 hypothetical protein SM116_18385 [Microbacterium rhizosphaerae]